MEVIDPHRFPTSAQEAFDGFGNRSRSFDGVSDYVDLGDSLDSVFAGTGAEFTISAWIKVNFNNSQAYGIITKDNYTGSLRQFNFQVLSSGSIRVVVTNTSGSIQRRFDSVVNHIQDDVWCHVAFTYDQTQSDNDKVVVYYNGSVISTNITNNNGSNVVIDDTSADLIIGAFHNSVNDPFYFSGNIADCRIFDSTLTSTDIASLYNGTDVQTNLVGHWLTDSDNVLDNAGSNNGTNYGSKYSYDNPSPPVEFGRASRSFDGVNDYIDLGDSLDSVFAGTGKQWSFTAWVKADTLNDRLIFAKWHNSNPDRAYFIRILSSGDLGINLSSDGTTSNRWGKVTNTSPINANTWHHVAVSYDQTATGNYIRLWVDGVEDTNLTDYLQSGTFTSIYDGSATIQISGINGTNSQDFDGKIADVRIYDTDLTSTDITNLYNGTDVQTNLVGHWLTDNDDVEDKAGSNDGTNYGSTYSYDNPPMDLIPSRQASRSFNSSSNYVDLGNDTSLDLTSMLAISFWVKPDTSHNGAILSKWITGGGGDNNSYSVYLGQDQGNDKISFLLQPSLGVGGGTRVRCDGSISLSTSEWSHVACVADSSTAKLYVNGVLDTSVSFTDTIKVTTNKLFIGKLRDQDTVYLFDGKIADVRLYDTDLSSTEVLDIYNGTTDRTNLIGQWLTNSDDVLDHAGTNDGTNNGSTYSTDSPS